MKVLIPNEAKKPLVLCSGDLVFTNVDTETYCYVLAGKDLAQRGDFILINIETGGWYNGGGMYKGEIIDKITNGTFDYYSKEDYSLKLMKN